MSDSILSALRARHLPRGRSGLALALLAALLAACISKQDRAARDRIFSHDPERKAPEAFDWSKPESALAMDADAAASRVGSFDWKAEMTWSVTQGQDQRVKMTERHGLRQLASGEFSVESDLDPQGVQRADTGKRVIYAGKMTYARSRYAPFDGYRERPTDRGRDARRFREESFGMAKELAQLVGPGLTFTSAGEAELLSRKVKRFTLSLARPAAAPTPAPAGPARDGGPDEQTRRHLAFLENRVAQKAEGELLADAETGVPLAITLRGVFGVPDDPALRIDFALDSRMTALGSAVAAVVPPKEVLPDDRKPRGVARALEAAGLKKQGEGGMGREEPGEESE